MASTYEQVRQRIYREEHKQWIREQASELQKDILRGITPEQQYEALECETEPINIWEIK